MGWLLSNSSKIRCCRKIGIALFPTILAVCAALPVMANVVAPLKRVAGDNVVVRLYNPSEIAVTGEVNGAPYTLEAYNTEEFPITGDLVNVVPSDDSQGTQLPNPVVDVEQDMNGMISSPRLFTDLTNTEQLVGPADGTLEVLAGDAGATIAVGVTGSDGKMLDMGIYSIDPNGLETIDPSTIAPLASNYSLVVSFLQGSGVGTVVTSANNDVTYTKLDERLGDMIAESLVSKWVKPSTSKRGIRVYKDDAKDLLQHHVDLFAPYILQDPAYQSVFSTHAECADFLSGLVDGDLSNGELYGDYPLKVKNDQLKLIVYKKDANGKIDYYGLDSSAGRGKPRRKLAINVAEGEAFIKRLLPYTVKDHGDYGGLNTSPVADDSTAKWAKKKPNW